MGNSAPSINRNAKDSSLQAAMLVHGGGVRTISTVGRGSMLTFKCKFPVTYARCLRTGSFLHSYMRRLVGGKMRMAFLRNSMYIVVLGKGLSTIYRISFKEKGLLLKLSEKHNYSSMIIPSSEVIKTSDGSFS